MKKKTGLTKWQIFIPNQKVEIMADFPAEKVEPDEKYIYEFEMPGDVIQLR